MARSHPACRRFECLVGISRPDCHRHLRRRCGRRRRSDTHLRRRRRRCGSRRGGGLWGRRGLTGRHPARWRLERLVGIGWPGGDGHLRRRRWCDAGGSRLGYSRNRRRSGGCDRRGRRSRRYGPGLRRSLKGLGRLALSGFTLGDVAGTGVAVGGFLGGGFLLRLLAAAAGDHRSDRRRPGLVDRPGVVVVLPAGRGGGEAARRRNGALGAGTRRRRGNAAAVAGSCSEGEYGQAEQA